MDTERELIDTCTLAAKVEDTNFRVGDTTVEARLGVRLEGVLDHDFHFIVLILVYRTDLVLAVAVATSGTASHCDGLGWRQNWVSNDSVLQCVGYQELAGRGRFCLAQVVRHRSVA